MEHAVQAATFPSSRAPQPAHPGLLVVLPTKLLAAPCSGTQPTAPTSQQPAALPTCISRSLLAACAASSPSRCTSSERRRAAMAVRLSPGLEVCKHACMHAAHTGHCPTRYTVLQCRHMPGARCDLRCGQAAADEVPALLHAAHPMCTTPCVQLLTIAIWACCRRRARLVCTVRSSMDWSDSALRSERSLRTGQRVGAPQVRRACLHLVQAMGMGASRTRGHMHFTHAAAASLSGPTLSHRERISGVMPLRYSASSSACSPPSSRWARVAACIRTACRQVQQAPRSLALPCLALCCIASRHAVVVVSQVQQQQQQRSALATKRLLPTHVASIAASPQRCLPPPRPPLRREHCVQQPQARQRAWPAEGPSGPPPSGPAWPAHTQAWSTPC